MGPTWGQGPRWAPWTLLSGYIQVGRLLTLCTFYVIANMIAHLPCNWGGTSWIKFLWVCPRRYLSAFCNESCLHYTLMRWPRCNKRCKLYLECLIEFSFTFGNELIFRITKYVIHIYIYIFALVICLLPTHCKWRHVMFVAMIQI